MNAKPEQLLSLIEKKTPVIRVQVVRNSGQINDHAIQFAKANGYKVTTESMSDPADPGGIMSTQETFVFKL